MSFADKIKPYKLQKWTGRILPDDKCYVCLRHFGVSEDDDEPACHALRPHCGHFIGSECFVQMLQTGRPMVCSMCQMPYPTAGPTLIRRIAFMVQWGLFSVEARLVGGIERIIYGRYPTRFAHMNYLLARGDIIFDMEMADDLFTIGEAPLVAFLFWLGFISMWMTALSWLLMLPMDYYVELWLLQRLFGIEVTDHSWLWALGSSAIIALLVILVEDPGWEDAMAAVEDPQFQEQHPVLYRVWMLLLVVLVLLPVSSISRVFYLALFLTTHGKVVLFIINWTFAIHAVVYRILVSRKFYK
jgi:hypothetical protein